ncbi:MAG: hypothetical protein AW09_003738 [Candidatus Accumulibacter phosphatis]|uniref:Uncharacterized protein n=1 Tax=Candidatus Accumulibacter phosphatis TaxID=327160 RepID=A0A080LS54_9PROT|nr:hypothetical protein [Accumulibacter sp.]KFB71141.1 MAG: hypothetical protein AW09_003738 [Candidatus Accumulibacter phosphatis]HRF11215.1 hypothetical protein [Candidatus Accumulibacter phosphatis]
MKIDLTDLRKLQASILASVAMFAAALAVLYVSQHTLDSEQLARLVATAQREEADGKLKRVRDEESEIRQKSILFNKLQERGMIGEEQRLDWVELLKDIRDKRRLLDLQYEISPQRLLDSNSAGDFSFAVSTMKVQLKLLHEEDLTRLLGDLRSQAKALILIKACAVERLPANADERWGGRENLLANCEIDWLTLHEVSRK